MPERAALRQPNGPVRVLVVEDNYLVAMDIMSIVRDHGGTVVGHATTGSRAIHMALQHKPDVVLMDIRLDGSLDGVSAASTIRRVQDTPIVFVTGQGDAVTMRRIADFGGAPILLKPIDPSALQTAIAQAARLL
jgi:two-component system, cell cycle sensor histidine kinase and response regulator CckA